MQKGNRKRKISREKGEREEGEWLERKERSLRQAIITL